MDDVMRTLACAGYVALACFFLPAGNAVAQRANLGCTSEPSASASQTLHCDNGITIVTESGAKFELKDRNRDGHVDAVELSSKALLLEVPKKPGGNRFEVLTPQAIAAVRGTKWAVDAADAKTSVFVVEGRVAGRRRKGSHSGALGPRGGVGGGAARPLPHKPLRAP